jgi:hypothetical protein
MGIILQLNFPPLGAKPIDRILHLQQIVQLPSVYDATAKEAASSTLAQPTVPVKKLVRQQPPGLKMRFRPIGFGNGKTGTIGSSSSSVDGSSTESASDEEMEDAPLKFRRPASLEQEESATSSDSSDDDSSSSSDADMVDAPPLPLKPAAKSKPEKSAAKESPKVADQSLKRKHREGGNVKAKTSSSSSATSTNNRELSEMKKKQKSSPADSQTVSAEATPSRLIQVAPTPIQPPTIKQNHSLSTSTSKSTVLRRLSVPSDP